MRFLPASLALTAGLTALRAEVRLPAIFGDHMVLQQQGAIPVWGTADPGEAVTVEFAGRKKTTRGDAKGNWRVDLDPVAATANPAELKVGDRVFKDVLVGEVWLCSGQSNMEFSLGASSTGKADLPQATDGEIRFFQVPRTDRAEPQADVGAKWIVCSPQTAGGFSAVAYYFAREIKGTTGGAPVGLIGSYWGGTPAQSWVSRDGLAQEPPFTRHLQQADADLDYFLKNKDAYPALEAEFLAARKQWEEAGKTGPQPKAPRNPNPGPGHATSLFNGMIHPLVPYAIKGAIWYQGESNASQPEEYRALFPRLITDWREKWGRGDFPFLFVQLAGFGGGRGNESYPLLREAQLKTLALPNTGMAVAIDIGDERDIHPKNKKDVGLRLAQAAKSVAYGQKVVSSGPLYQAMKVEGKQVRLKFQHTGGGLVLGEGPSGFTVAGLDGCWHEASAKVDRDTLLVASPQVSAPVAVRYAWAGFGPCALSNKEGLPASPFRTDDWPRAAEPDKNTGRHAVPWMEQCAARVAAFKGKRCDLIFIGDSITQNFIDPPRPGWNLVGNEVWEKYYGRRHALNFGVGSDTTRNVLWRLENMDVRDLRPRVAVVLVGTNNTADSPADIAAGVKAVVNKARATFPGVKVIVTSILPTARETRRMADANEIIRTCADGKSVFYLDLASKMTPQGNSWKGLGHDRLHLTPEGYELWAREMNPLIETLVPAN